MQKPMRLTDLIPAIATGMPYINTVILVYLQVLDPDPGIRMRNPASAKTIFYSTYSRGKGYIGEDRPTYPASANDSESVR